jgi:hypothetical protein
MVIMEEPFLYTTQIDARLSAGSADGADSIWKITLKGQARRLVPTRWQIVLARLSSEGWR